MTQNKILLAQNSAFIANRLPRAARALKEADYEVDILNWNRGVNAEIIQNATKSFGLEGITVHSIYCGNTPYGKGIITIFNKILFIIKVILFLFKNGHQYKVVHAIDFDLALPVYIAKLLNPKLKFEFIYDIADFVETFHSPIPKFIRSMIKSLSERIMNHAKVVIIPDENRLVNIPKEFQNKTVIINNSIDPPQQTVDYEVKINGDTLNIFYYGALSKDRGIELLLKQKNVSLWFAGKGELQGEIVENADTYDNIHYLGYLQLEQILSVASQMDVIYMVYDPSYQHNQIASPNKLYEALYLGKPCIVAENTSINLFVEKYDIGYITKFDEHNLSKMIKSISKEELIVKGSNAKSIYPAFSWDTSKRKLIEIYKSNTKKGDTI
ncbi:glycosyltransferase [Lysinibacillus xylanilyticus]|uniref:glycosyltransferase n=1 Tax=Lysinibacillus xylanilyticus TaxID=582475 RepID=UPI00083C9A50|nr:glycosyltransferase [Lysinibacillus xylanilyticus]